MAEGEERWVDIEGVAVHLGVTKDSLYRWTKKPGFPVHRVGRLFRFKLSEVDVWVKSGQAADPNPIDDKAK
jgi:excisionase family DNA binding protein